MAYMLYSFTIPDSVGGVVATKAIEMFKKIRKYARTKWPEHDCQILKDRTGKTSHVHVMWKVSSLADGEQFVKTYYQDSGIKTLLAEWGAAEREAGSVLIADQAVAFYDEIE